MTDSSRKTLTVVILLVAAAIAGYFLWQFLNRDDAAAAQPQSARAIPVRISSAQEQDVIHWINAVGTVEPIHRVVIRAQVEGVLTDVRFEEGQNVAKGQLLAQIDDRVLQATLRSAEANLLSNESQLRNAERDLQRYRTLAESNAISKQVLDQQGALVEQLQAQINRDKATIEDAQVRLSYTAIASPVSGRVGIRNVDPGNFVRVSDADGLVTVTQMHPISVLFSLPQTALPALRSQLLLPDSQVEAVQRESGKVLGKGPVSAIDNAIRPGSGTVQVRARFDNEDEALWPGQFVAVRVPVGISTAAVVVPSVAVRLGLDGNYVYRIGEDERAELVVVTPGYRDEATGVTVIEDGLAAGDTIVTDGFVRLRPGAKVSAQATAQAADATSAQPRNGEQQQ